MDTWWMDVLAQQITSTNAFRRACSGVFKNGKKASEANSARRQMVGKDGERQRVGIDYKSFFQGQNIKILTALKWQTSGSYWTKKLHKLTYI